MSNIEDVKRNVINPKWLDELILKVKNNRMGRFLIKNKKMNTLRIAQVAHEINKAYCESIGDNSQPTWENAPAWQKSSAVNGVEFHIANPDASPASSHESWLKQKTEEGWTYGKVKDPEKKEHPCFLPYDQLPVSERSKDYLFKQVIHSLKNINTSEEI